MNKHYNNVLINSNNNNQIFSNYNNKNTFQPSFNRNKNPRPNFNNNNGPIQCYRCNGPHFSNKCRLDRVQRSNFVEIDDSLLTIRCPGVAPFQIMLLHKI